MRLGIDRLKQLVRDNPDPLALAEAVADEQVEVILAKLERRNVFPMGEVLWCFKRGEYV